MKVLTITESNVSTNWDATQQQLGASFLQSASWADFQHALGHEVIALRGEGWSALCVVYQTSLGSYWFIPAGPTVMAGTESVALQNIRQLAAAAGALWVRFELRGSWEIPSGLNIIRAPRNVQPMATSLVNLQLPLDTLWRNIHTTHGSNIKRFEKAGGYCETSYCIDDVDKFYEMYQGLSAKTGGVFHSHAYLRRQAELMMPTGRMRLELAYSATGELLAGCIIQSFSGVSTYVYAASSPAARIGINKGAGPALVWHAIKTARESGDQSFDLFGIAPNNVSGYESWAGFTAFKRRFGGDDLTYLPTYDMPISPRYLVAYGYMMAQNYKRRLRRIARTIVPTAS